MEGAMSDNLRVQEVDVDGGLAQDLDWSLSGLGVDMNAAAYNMSEALLALPVYRHENVENKFQYILAAPTSPLTKVNEETLTYLNQGQPYEVKLKKLGDVSEFQGKSLRSVIKVCFHERRLQYQESEHFTAWRTARPGERVLNVDVPLSYSIFDVKSPKEHNINAVQFLWDPTKETGVFVQVNCFSTEFTPKKHGGEKGVPFRIQIDTYSNGDGDAKFLHSAFCQVKVFKPKGADRKNKTDREKMDKLGREERERYQPSYDCTVFTEAPLDTQLQPDNAASGSTFGMTRSSSSSSAVTIAASHDVTVVDQQQSQPQHANVKWSPPKSHHPQHHPQMPHHQHQSPISATFNSDRESPMNSEGLHSPEAGGAGAIPTMNGWTGGGGPVVNPQATPSSLVNHSSFISIAMNGHNSAGNGVSPVGSYGANPVSSLDEELAATAMPAAALTIHSSATIVEAWLHRNRFSNYVRVFGNFSGEDLLRLSREDFVQICGLADGIRLDNALQRRHARPRLTLYVCMENDHVYHPVYLESPALNEFKAKLAEVARLSPDAVKEMYCQGPSGIHIFVSEQFVANMRDSSRLAVRAVKEEGSDKIFVLFRILE